MKITGLELANAICEISEMTITECLRMLPMITQFVTRFELDFCADLVKVPIVIDDYTEADLRKMQVDGDGVATGLDQNGVDYCKWVGKGSAIGSTIVNASQPCKAELCFKEKDLVGSLSPRVMQEVARKRAYVLVRQIVDAFFASIDITDSPPINGQPYPFAAFDGISLIDIEQALECDKDCDFTSLILNKRYKYSLRKDKCLFPPENVANVSRDAAVLSELFTHNSLSLSFPDYFPDPKGDNLSGFAMTDGAMAMVTTPTAALRPEGSDYLEFGTTTDADTGLTMLQRLWHEPSCQEYRASFELNVGFKVLKKDEICPLVSA